MKKILLLEDDTLLGETVVELLESESYRVDWAKDGSKAADLSYENSYDLYIFDVNVPFLDGFDLLESLREARDTTPTLFMSARVDLESIAHGFKAGAFDYIKKPFFPQELLIRVNAKIGTTRSKIVAGDIEYDPQTKEVRLKGELLQLGEVQMVLFDLFMHSQNIILEKDELLDCLNNPSPTALRVAINKLKQTTSLNIKNIRGVGYILETS
jgi:DNA-binding response OmpR family regulator